MKFKNLGGLAPKDNKESKYRTSAEIFETSQKDAGGVKRYTSAVIMPRHIPVSEVEGAYAAIRESCYFHYDTFYSGQGIDFKYYESAYQFGAEIAASPEYKNVLWVDAKNKVQAQWEAVNPGTWDDHRVQIVHGWNLTQQMKLRKKRTATT